MKNRAVRTLLFFAPSIALALVIALELLFKISIPQKVAIYLIISVPSFAALVVMDKRRRTSEGVKKDNG